MLGLSARSGALAAGLVLTATLISPLGQAAYADDVVPAPIVEAPVTQDPATPAPATALVVTPKPAPAAYPVLKQGSRGTAVLKLEKRVLVPRADRVFDAFTKKRVKQIQKWGHIPRTGKVDYRTALVISSWGKDQAAKRKAASRAGSAELGRIIAVARQYKGRPYVYGAAGPRAFDCSGFTRFVVRKATGRSLPHQSGAQSTRVTKVSRSKARAGDLIFFHSGGGIYHVGIYAGGNKLWHSSRPGTVTGLGTIFSSNVTFGRVA